MRRRLSLGIVAGFLFVLVLAVVAGRAARAADRHYVYIPYVRADNGLVGIAVRPPWESSPHFRHVDSRRFRSVGTHTLAYHWRAPSGAEYDTVAELPIRNAFLDDIITSASQLMSPYESGVWTVTASVDGQYATVLAFRYNGDVIQPMVTTVP